MYQPLVLELGKQHVRINQYGGGVISYTSGEHEIIYGYEEGTQAGSMGDVLFPFPGRVENAAYSFRGRDYQLKGVSLNGNNAIHGFAKNALWEVGEQSANSASLIFRMTEEEFDPKGFPFALTLTLTYSLDNAGLRVDCSVQNEGNTAAPFGLGFHPYFRVGTASINDISLTLPARKQVEFDADLKPTGALLPVEKFSTSEPVGDTILDTCFTDLLFEDGIAKTVLKGENESVIIWQDELFPYLQIYSSDTLHGEHVRKGLAVEPQTCCGFAFNLPDVGLRVLEAGEVFKGSWGINVQE